MNQVRYTLMHACVVGFLVLKLATDVVLNFPLGSDVKVICMV